MRRSAPSADPPRPSTRSSPHPRATSGATRQPIPLPDRSPPPKPTVRSSNADASSPGFVVVVGLALAAVIAVLLLRGEGQSPVPPVPASTSHDARAGRDPSAGGPYRAEPVDPTTTTPSTDDASTFVLPEGTKLQRGEGDPALVEELQQALSKAGYDPGPADGTFGRRTEAAVVAFQEANGLSVDGRVGPETASALNSALADS